jgi:hypothetical protein
LKAKRQIITTKAVELKQKIKQTIAKYVVAEVMNLIKNNNFYNV